MATGRKTVVVGQVIDPTTWGNPLWDQSVQTFASAADRAAQFASPKQGAVTWLEDVKQLQVFNGTAWVSVAQPTDTSAAFALDTALWTQIESSLWRIAGWWYWHLTVSNKVTGAFAAGPAALGVIPGPARIVNVAGVGSYYMAPTFYSLSGEPFYRAAASQITWAGGAVQFYIPQAIASQPAGQFAVRIDAAWPAT